MRDFQVDEMSCLSCGKLLDGAMNLQGDQRPKEGDISICIDCEYLMVFTFVDNHLKLRQPTDEELQATIHNPEIEFFRYCLREAKRRRAEEL